MDNTYTSKHKAWISCPVCGVEIKGKNLKKLDNYKLYHCPQCNFMFWYPMEALTAEGYSEYIQYRHASFRNQPNSQPWRWDVFFKSIPLRSGMLLDVGCARGEFVAMALKHGFSASGIDIASYTGLIADPEVRDKCRTASLSDYIKENGEEKFDILTFFEVLEHTGAISQFLVDVYRAVKKGGYVACTVPNRRRYRFAPFFFPENLRDCPPHHLAHWNAKSLSVFFEKHGLKVVKTVEEPFSLFDVIWSTACMHQLRLDRLGFFVSHKAGEIGEKKAGPNLTRFFINCFLKFGIFMYIKVFTLLAGIVTIPLKLLLRRTGNSIFILARKV